MWEVNSAWCLRSSWNFGFEIKRQVSVIGLDMIIVYRWILWESRRIAEISAGQSGKWEEEGLRIPRPTNMEREAALTWAPHACSRVLLLTGNPMPVLTLLSLHPLFLEKLLHFLGSQTTVVWDSTPCLRGGSKTQRCGWCPRLWKLDQMGFGGLVQEAWSECHLWAFSFVSVICTVQLFTVPVTGNTRIGKGRSWFLMVKLSSWQGLLKSVGLGKISVYCD